MRSLSFSCIALALLAACGDDGPPQRDDAGVVLPVDAPGIDGPIAQRTWTLRSYQPPYAGVAFGGGTLVTTSFDAFQRSTDGGATWSYSRVNDTTLRQIVHDGTRFVAAGHNTVWSSMDGATWTADHVFQTTEWLGGIGTFGTQTIVVGDPGGEVWTRDGNGAFGLATTATSGMRVVASGGGAAIVGGNNGIILRSTDGTTWSPVTTNVLYSLQAATYGSAGFVVVGAAGGIHSADGMTWSATNLPSSAGGFTGVTFAAGRYIATDDAGGTYYSTDGASFTAVASGASSLNAIGHDGTNFVAVGTAGVVVRSSNGTSWTRVNGRLDGASNELTALVAGSGRLVAAGSHGTGGVISTTTDGATWADQIRGAAVLDVDYGANQFVAVDSAAILYSSDGLSWSNAGTHSLYPASVAHGAAGWVIAGCTGTTGTILHSTTGTGGWMTRAPASGTFPCFRWIAHRAGRYMALAYTAMWTSTDAITWTRVNVPIGFHARGIAANASEFVVCDDAKAFRTTDGNLFVTLSYGNAASTSPLETSYAAGRFFCPGVQRLISSTNGDVWEIETAPAGSPLAFAEIAGSLVAVGSSSLVLTATP